MALDSPPPPRPRGNYEWIVYIHTHPDNTFPSNADSVHARTVSPIMTITMNDGVFITC